ncbi:MAG: tRNA (adenosine(37)-N6)-threonylcarbamoyltransferase complex dimerization subunit type 1 TsaB [Phycisphaerae bacterium]
MADDVYLAIETSTRSGGVALARRTGPPAVRTLFADRRHAAELLPAIHEVLCEHDLHAGDVGVVCFSHGPGSFTGLRIAATVTRTLCHAVGCRAVAVPTLESIARNALRAGIEVQRLAVILDARRGQVFAAAFDVCEGALQMRSPVAIHDPTGFLSHIESPFAVLGEGVASHRAACEASGGVILDESLWTPKAETALEIGRELAAAGRFCAPEQIVPFYVRPPECEEVYEQRRAAARARRG